MSDESRTMENPHHFMGVSREKITWCPNIDYDKCTNCQDCIKFCAHDVYGKDAEKIFVQNPANCVVFCQACAKMCPIEGALSFPAKKDVLNQIKEIKAQQND
jgi:NAD-dependent dihydropyrimidine dehydrogenase PreA subunit